METIEEEPRIAPEQEEIQPQKNYWKIAVLSFIGVFIAAGLIFAGFYFGQQKQTTQSETTTTTPATIVSSSPTTTVPQDSGIPITANTVSFARDNGKLYLQYKGKIYEARTMLEPQQISLPNVTWYGLVNTPATATGFDEVFDIAQVPNKQSFIFTIRWDTSLGNNQNKQTITVYLYDPAKQGAKVETLLTINPDLNVNTYQFPHGIEISSDGKYAAFDMNPCWNCGGGYPQTMVMNLKTKTTKNIGQASYFAWKDNGKYEYKDYIAQPCPTPTGIVSGEYIIGECPKDPQTLPIKSGQI